MDNFQKSCPPARMQDGARELGDYKTSAQRNEYIKFLNGIWRDDQYRLFLQSNTTEIMDREWGYFKKNNNCWTQDCIHTFPTLSTPQQYVEQRRLAEAQVQGRLNCKDTCKKYPDYRLNPDLNINM